MDKIVLAKHLYLAFCQGAGVLEADQLDVDKYFDNPGVFKNQLDGWLKAADLMIDTIDFGLDTQRSLYKSLISDSEKVNLPPVMFGSGEQTIGIVFDRRSKRKKGKSVTISADDIKVIFERQRKRLSRL